MQTIEAIDNQDAIADRYTITLDDDPAVHRIIEKVTGLKSFSYDTSTQLLQEAGNYRPLAAFVDIHLGLEGSGLDVIPTLREKWPYCPIIVITSDQNEQAISEALAAGADDFVRKPIKPMELMARLQTRLKDVAEKAAKELIHIGDLEIDLTHRAITSPTGQRYLSPTEMSLLTCLVQAQGTVVPRDTLKRRCWGQITVSDNALDRKLHEVRRALKDLSQEVKIRTIYGVGVVLELGKDHEGE